MSQEWSLTPQAAPAPRLKGRGALITGIVLIVVALILGVVGVVGLVSRGISTLAAFAEPVQSPTASVNTLEAGTEYIVYELTGSTGPSFGPSEVSVAAPGGATVPVSPMGSVTDTQFTSGSDTFAAVARFTAPTSGSYSTSVAAEGALFVVGPGLSSLTGFALFGLLIGLAVLVGIVGIVLIIVGAVRRSSSRKAAAAYAGGYGSPTAYPAAPQQYPSYGQQGVPLTPEPTVAPLADDQPFASPAPQPVAPQPVAPQPVAPQPVAPQPVAPPVQALPPAGWYPDPGRPGGQRYWDGTAWTQHQA